MPGAESEAPDDPGRQESVEEREDRNLGELLQELRVASLGVQVLFGFLLSLPFSARFAHLDQRQRYLYVAVLLLAAIATTQLSAPVAYHRAVFRHHRKAQLLHISNILALTGLGTVGLAICGAVLLVASVVLTGIAVVLVEAVIVVVVVGLWLALPMWGRLSSDRSDRQSTAKREVASGNGA
jgi:Family of unknown function (DUF6328)